MALTYRNIQDATGLHFDQVKSLERRKVFNLNMDLLAATHAICRFLYNSKIKTLGVGSLDPAQELARRNKEMADKYAMANAVSRGELLHVDSVRKLIIDAFTRVRTKMLGIPNKLTIRLVGLRSETEIYDLLDDSIREALTELSEQGTVDAAMAESASEEEAA